MDMRSKTLSGKPRFIQCDRPAKNDGSSSSNGLGYFFPASKEGVSRRKTLGYAVLTVLFSIMFLTILITSYFSVAREAQHSMYRFAEEEAVLQMAEGGMEEAFHLVDRKLAVDPVWQNWLLEQAEHYRNGRSANMAPQVFPLPVVKMLVARTGRRAQDFQVEGQAALVDFRSKSRKDPTGKFELYSQDNPHEGLGTLELKVNVKKSGGLAGSNVAREYIRHHFLKIVSMVTARDNNRERIGFSQNSLQDYVLFLNRGLEEFWTPQRTLATISVVPFPMPFMVYGLSLNNPDHVLEIEQPADASKRGLIALTGAPSADRDFWFLNLNASMAARVQPEKKIEVSKREVYDLAKPYFVSEGISMVKVDSFDFRKKEFRFHFFPVHPLDCSFPAGVFSDLASSSFMYRYGLGYDASLPAINSFFPGSPLMGADPVLCTDQDFARSVLEGTVRQGVFMFSEFYARIKVETLLDSDSMTIGPFPLLYPRIQDIFLDSYFPASATNSALHRETYVHFAEEVESYSQRTNRGAGNDSSMYVGVNADEPFFSMPTPNPKQGKFFNRLGEEVPGGTPGVNGVRPFSSADLWPIRIQDSAEKSYLKSLMDEGILVPQDSGEDHLYLRGMIQIRCRNSTKVALGSEDRPVRVFGQGGLIASVPIIVMGKIQKNSPEDLCVLVSRDSIILDTPEQVDAVLMAMFFDPQRSGERPYLPINPATGLIIPGSHARGSVIAMQPFTLKGALIADFLFPSLWAPGKNKIIYDPVLKSLQTKFQFIVQPSICFQRLTGEQ
jgi:hypothetical protein